VVAVPPPDALPAAGTAGTAAAAASGAAAAAPLAPAPAGVLPGQQGAKGEVPIRLLVQVSLDCSAAQPVLLWECWGPDEMTCYVTWLEHVLQPC
jgi:hypothetical protein